MLHLVSNTCPFVIPGNWEMLSCPGEREFLIQEADIVTEGEPLGDRTFARSLK